MTLYVAAKTSLVVEKMLLESLLAENYVLPEGLCFKTPEAAQVTRGPNEAIFAVTVIVEQIDPRL